jgi:hypothetical protein
MPLADVPCWGWRGLTVVRGGGDAGPLLRGEAAIQPAHQPQLVDVALARQQRPAACQRGDGERFFTLLLCHDVHARGCRPMCIEIARVRCIGTGTGATSSSMLDIVSQALAPSSSAKMHPAAHTSTAPPYRRQPSSSSGARYQRVPTAAVRFLSPSPRGCPLAVECVAAAT